MKNELIFFFFFKKKVSLLFNTRLQQYGLHFESQVPQIKHAIETRISNRIDLREIKEKLEQNFDTTNINLMETIESNEKEEDVLKLLDIGLNF